MSTSNQLNLLIKTILTDLSNKKYNFSEIDPDVRNIVASHMVKCLPEVFIQNLASHLIKTIGKSHVINSSDLIQLIPDNSPKNNSPTIRTSRSPKNSDKPQIPITSTENGVKTFDLTNIPKTEPNKDESQDVMDFFNNLMKDLADENEEKSPKNQEKLAIMDESDQENGSANGDDSQDILPELGKLIDNFGPTPAKKAKIPYNKGKKKLRQCLECGKIFDRKYNFERHVTTQHNSQEFQPSFHYKPGCVPTVCQEYTCLICNDKFPTAEKFGFHVKQAHNKNAFACPICKIACYNRVNSVMRHMKDNHPNDFDKFHQKFYEYPELKKSMLVRKDYDKEDVQETFLKNVGYGSRKQIIQAAAEITGGTEDLLNLPETNIAVYDKSELQPPTLNQ